MDAPETEQGDSWLEWRRVRAWELKQAESAESAESAPPPGN